MGLDPRSLNYKIPTVSPALGRWFGAMERYSDRWDRRSFMQLALAAQEHFRKSMDARKFISEAVEASRASYEESLRLLQQVDGLGQGALIAPVMPPSAPPIIVSPSPAPERANSN